MQINIITPSYRHWFLTRIYSVLLQGKIKCTDTQVRWHIILTEQEKEKLPKELQACSWVVIHDYNPDTANNYYGISSGKINQAVATLGGDSFIYLHSDDTLLPVDTLSAWEQVATANPNSKIIISTHHLGHCTYGDPKMSTFACKPENMREHHTSGEQMLLHKSLWKPFEREGNMDSIYMNELWNTVPGLFYFVPGIATMHNALHDERWSEQERLKVVYSIQ